MLVANTFTGENKRQFTGVPGSLVGVDLDTQDSELSLPRY
jgi:hypothetical protein